MKRQIHEPLQSGKAEDGIHSVSREISSANFSKEPPKAPRKKSPQGSKRGKGVWALALAMGLVLALSACSSSTGSSSTASAAEPNKDKSATVSAIMITGDGAVDENGLDQQAWKGFQKAAEESGDQIQCLQSNSGQERQKNMETALAKHPDMIIGVGYSMEDVVKAAAKDNPDQKFGLIDGQVDAPNVACITFQENESSFLVGVAAALTTQTKTVGFVGGESTYQDQQFQYGFQAGVKSVDPNIRVLVDYTETFDDPAKGEASALTLIKGQADVIFQAAGNSGAGVIQAAAEKGIWAIGLDEDQSAANPKTILCSMIKASDRASYDLISAVSQDKFKAGITVYNLKNGGVGYSDDAGNLTDDVKAKMDAFSKKIIDGTIKVPNDRDGFDTFTAPTE